MARPEGATRHRAARAATAAGLAAAAAAATYAAQRAHERRIAADPENGFLSDPPVGRPLEVHSADGTRLHAEVFGRDDAPTLVLAHGWTEDLTYWAYQIRELAPDVRIVAYDLRGHDRSARAVGGDYSPARFGEDVAAVLAAAVPAGERAAVAGHSLGAMSIAAFAEHHDVEARVHAAALLNTGVDQLLAESELIKVPHFAASVAESVSRRGFLGSRAPLPRISSPLQHALIRYFAFGPAASPAQVAFYERMLIACPPDVRADVGTTIADLDLLPALANLTVPTLVMAGDRDRLTPASHARRIAGALPDLARLEILADTGHMGPLERPREFSAALRELALSHAGAGAKVG